MEQKAELANNLHRKLLLAERKKSAAAIEEISCLMDKVHHLSVRLMVSVHKNDSQSQLRQRELFLWVLKGLKRCSNINLGIFLQIEGKAKINTNAAADVAMKEITRKIKDDNTQDKGTCF